ncbi:hypothetical protein CEXT_317241 [Caerostris extrusa]|uniref:Uncharacterized protein n=1 Tax=Caerostris extrusa TaxID=172846 RepID=A0AAV4P6G0_CAEEX|nr:hypothetical protein CEXT_317241 [Caerostris extrusa]
MGHGEHKRGAIHQMFWKGRRSFVVLLKLIPRHVLFQGEEFLLQCLHLHDQDEEKFRRIVEIHSETRTIPGRRVPFASVCICMIRTRFVFVCGYGSLEKAGVSRKYWNSRF